MGRILAVALNPAIDVSCEAGRVQPTLKVRTHDQHHYPGGGGTNVARVIATLGGTPELVYLSGGATGNLFDDLLSREKITTHRFAAAGDMRIALMVHEKETGFEYRFVPEGPEVLAGEIKPVMDFVAAFDGDYLIASGSLPEGVPADTYAQMADLAAKNNVRFILDTSSEALRAALDSSKVFLLKPSLRELELLVGEKLDEEGARRAAASIIERGAADHVVVSMGREGALLANTDGVVRVPSMRVVVRSAVGAGDSFVGAMTWSLSEGHTVANAFRFGVAAGAAAAMTSGTELCRRDDVLALFKASG